MHRSLAHRHAVDRLQERFGLDESWLRQELDSGRFVWLKGSGNSGTTMKVRSGHLIFVPNRNEYCVVVVDDRSRLAITVLTEEMARHSSWGSGLNEAAKLKAKRLALGEEMVDDSQFLRLYAEERGGLLLKLRIKTLTYEWNPTVQTVCTAKVLAEQIDMQSKRCTLTPSQENEVANFVSKKIANREIRPYCDFYLMSNRGRSVLVVNKFDGIVGLEDGEMARRWHQNLTD